MGVSYATTIDFGNFGLPATVGTSVSTYDAIVTAQLEASSRFADTFIAARCVLPLTSWTTSLTRIVCEHAAYNVLSVIGFNKSAPNDQAVYTRQQKAIEWLEQIAQGQRVPDFVPVNPAAMVASDPPRGWWSENTSAPFEPIT